MQISKALEDAKNGKATAEQLRLLGNNGIPYEEESLAAEEDELAEVSLIQADAGEEALFEGEEATRAAEATRAEANLAAATFESKEEIATRERKRADDFSAANSVWKEATAQATKAAQRVVSLRSQLADLKPGLDKAKQQVEKDEIKRNQAQTQGLDAVAEVKATEILAKSEATAEIIKRKIQKLEIKIENAKEDVKLAKDDVNAAAEEKETIQQLQTKHAPSPNGRAGAN